MITAKKTEEQTTVTTTTYECSLCEESFEHHDAAHKHHNENHLPQRTVFGLDIDPDDVKLGGVYRFETRAEFNSVVNAYSAYSGDVRWNGAGTYAYWVKDEHSSSPRFCLRPCTDRLETMMGALYEIGAATGRLRKFDTGS
jgi:hypothetical protein